MNNDVCDNCGEKILPNESCMVIGNFYYHVKCTKLKINGISVDLVNVQHR